MCSSFRNVNPRQLHLLRTLLPQYFTSGKPTTEMFATDQVSSLQSPYNPASIFLSSIADD
jgi:hypothetical protein